MVIVVLPEMFRNERHGGDGGEQQGERNDPGKRDIRCVRMLAEIFKPVTKEGNTDAENGEEENEFVRDDGRGLARQLEEWDVLTFRMAQVKQRRGTRSRGRSSRNSGSGRVRL